MWYTELKDGVDVHLNSLKMYDCLWEDELHTTYKVFSDSQPSLDCCKTMLEELQSAEDQVLTYTISMERSAGLNFHRFNPMNFSCKNFYGTCLTLNNVII